jgi:hypothetical protein
MGKKASKFMFYVSRHRLDTAIIFGCSVTLSAGF